MRWLAILCVVAYRAVLRPFYERICLYEESCSAFAIRTLRNHGFNHGLPVVVARLRSCRMPVRACFVLDDHGDLKMLSATTYDGGPVAPKAVEMLVATVRAHHAGSEISTQDG